MRRKFKQALRSFVGLRNNTDYYSQGGEDAIVSNTFSSLLKAKEKFYMDIGAYHPFNHSNTYILYKAGWRGVNIDPRPGFKTLFDRHRKRDINIEAGIASSDGQMTYYMLEEESTMNTFSRQNLERLGIFDQVKKTKDIPVYTISSLLAKYPQIPAVDYLNIDAEGFDQEILDGIDFNKFTPSVISIEQNDVLTLKDVLDSAVCKWLSAKSYTPYAKNILLPDVSTVFYIYKGNLPASGNNNQ